MPVFDNPADRAHDIGLGIEVHRQVWPVPVTEDAEPDEVLALVVYLAQGELAACPAELVGFDLDPDLAQFLFYLVFDRQSVAVPAGYVGRVLAV